MHKFSRSQLPGTKMARLRFWPDLCPCPALLRPLSLFAGLLFSLILCSGPALAKSRVKIGLLTITAYHKKGLTASGARTRPGYIALSRDLEKKYQAKFGDTVIVKGVGWFTFQDRLPKKWHTRGDVFLSSRRAAKVFGKKHQPVLLVRKAPTNSKAAKTSKKFS